MLGDLLPQGLAGQAELAGALPALHEQEQQDQEGGRGERGQDDEHVAGLLGPAGGLGKAPLLLLPHRAEGRADPVRVAKAAIGQDEPEGRLGSLLAPQANGLAQLFELVPQRDLQVAELPLDVRTVRGEATEGVDVGLDDVGRRGERRRQVALVAGQEKAALAGLRVGDSRADAVELGHDLAAAPDRLVLLDEVARADRDHRDGTEDGGGHRELEGHPVANEPVGHVASARGIMSGCIVGQGPGRFKRSWGAVATARRGRLGGRAAVGRNYLNRRGSPVAPTLQFLPSGGTSP